MKRYLCMICLAIAFLMPLQTTFSAPLTEPSPQKEVPGYAKWSGIAVQAVRNKYSNSLVYDFQYIGCKALSPIRSAQIFRLWVEQNKRKFMVYVTVEFETASEKVHTIKFEESNEKIDAYHKWSDLASQLVRTKYPKAKIVDFRPIGCKSISSDISEQTFKFWMTQANQSFLVNVRISYEIPSEKVLSSQILMNN